MCGASDHAGCRWTDRSSRPSESRPSLRAVGGLAILVCLAASVLVSSGVGLPGPGSGFGSGIGPMAPILLGLAAGGDTGRDDGLERLTTAVEELVARIDERQQRRTDALEPDADGDAQGDAIRLGELDNVRGRDEEIDRLASAIDDLAATVREREHQLSETERYRKELYRITSAADATGEEKIRRLLELGCERLDVEAGFVSRVDEAAGRYEVQIASENDVVEEGLETDLSNVYCRETISADDILGIYNAAEEEYEDHPNYEEFGIGCYLGGRIDVDGDHYGTLCFVDREPRDESFTVAERTFVDLMTRWVSHEFERREHERQLERYRAFTDDILNAVDDIVYVLDEDGRLRRWNESVREVTGYADSDLEEMHAVEFVPESDRDAIAAATEAVVETGTSRVEADLVTATGDRIPYEFVASTLEDPDGDRVIAGIGRDISDRKEKEQRLERYRAFTEDMLDAVDDIFYVVDVDEGIQRWNQTLVDVTGYSHAEIEAMDVRPLYFDDDAWEVIEASVEEVFETGSTRVEAPITTKDGERIPYEFVASLLEDPDGDPIEVGIGRDISDRKRYERELERTTQLLEQTQRLAGVGGWVLDVTGDANELQLTDEAARIHGFSPDADVGVDRAIERYHPDDRPRIRRAIERAIETGDSYDLELRLTGGADDQQWIRAIGDPVRENGDVVSIRGAVQDVTDRKMRERTLRETTQRLEAIIEASPAAIVAFDTDGTVEQWNAAAEEMFGWSEAAVLGDRLPFVPDDRTDEFDRFRRRLLEGETLAGVETKRETKDGDLIDVSLSAAPMYDADGEIIGIMGALEDITERKERERELRETNETLSAIIEASPAALIALDRDDTVTLWNPAAERIFGWSDDEVIGNPVPIVPEERSEDHQRILERGLEGERITGVETSRRRKDGEMIDVSVSVAPIRDADGEIIGTMGALEDITERKDRERRLETTTARLEALFENSPDIIDVLDDEGTIVEANQRLCRELGYAEDELIGTKIWEYEQLFDADDVLELLAELDVGERRKFEGRFERCDGSSFPVEVHLIHLDLELEGGDESRFMAICRDVSDRKARERDLQETKRRLELALKGSNTGIWEWNVDTDDIAWDETLERMLGLEPGGFEETYEGFRRRVHPDDVESVERALEAAVENSEPYRAEFRMRHVDGHWIWFVARGRLMSEGGETRMLGIVNDITQRKESEQQLRQRERELQRHTEYTADVLDAIDDVFYVLDEEYELQRWNASLAAVTGYTDAELEEMNSLELIAADEREAVRDGLDNIDELRGVPLEADVVTKDGERIPYEFVAAPLSDPDGRPVIAGIGRDISERVEKERQLSRLISNIPGLVYRATNEPDWPIEFVSEGVREMTGYEPAALESGEIGWDEDVKRATGTWEQVQDALEAGERFNLTYPIETADGERRWVKEQGRGVYADDGSVEAIEGVVIDITERVAYERELERTTDLLERVQRMAAVGGWEVDMTDEPRTVIWTDELYRLHDLPRDVMPDLETTIQCYHPDDRSFVRERLEAAIATESGYELEARLRNEAGDVRWVRANGEPIYEDGDLVKYRGSVQDITDQKEREQTLELLNETARGLLNSETETAVADLVVDTATELLEDGSAALYLLDAETNRFEPIASTVDFGERTDGAPSVAVGDSESVLWNTYVTETQTVVDNAVTDEQSPLFSDGMGGLLVPIGDHGVFVLTAPPAAIDDETRQLFETLVATTEAAFDRLESEASLRERDAELEARNRRLRRQIAINELIRRIDQSLIGAESRAEIERTVPERLIESDDIAFAWIGTVDGGGTLEPRTWAGTGTGEAYLDAVSLELADADSDADDGTGAGAEPAVPAVRTARSEGTTIVENVVDRLQQEGWRRDALDAGFQSVVAVPLAFEEYTYGVLAVYADEPDAFTDLEQTVFTELGESIANAINAVKTREALHAETFVELTLELSAGEDILSRIARATGAAVAYEGLGTASAEQTVLFFETSGVDADDVTTALENLVTVTDYRLIRESDGDCLFEATVAGEVVASRLVRYGGSPRTIAADGDRTAVTVDVPMGTDIREFVEMLRDHYASVELQSQQHVQRATQTRQELLAGLFEPLTDRQLEVLRTAYFAGFFEWPRESTGEEIAEMLEVTQPTVNRHLRIGQQRLLSQLFDDESLALTRE